MMEREKDEPFVRESWQRLLREGDDAPSEATDLRIHTEARRSLASRPVRWWVPASLAASFVLVVMLVQLQYAGLSRQPSIGESEVALDEMATKPSVILNAPAAEGEAPAAYAVAPAVVAPAAPPAAAEPDPESRFTTPVYELPTPKSDLPMMDGRTTAVTGSPPEAAREEREASELKRERADSPPPAELGVAAPPPAAKEAAADSARSSAFGNLVASKVAAEDTRTPEAWYAEIEALRDAGRIEEAEAELKKLEATHPGWLAKNHPPKP